MGLKLNNCTFVNCAGGVSAPESLEVEATDTRFMGGGQAFYFYQPGVLHQIGLPEGTPRELIDELLTELRAHREASKEQKVDVVRKSRLGGWLAGLGAASTIAKNIVDIFDKVS